MKPFEVSERTRRQLESLPPEKRAAAEAAIARTQTPEYRARESVERDAIQSELRETGRVAMTPAEELDGLGGFLESLRREREGRGLSLNDLAERSGIDKSALSRLENGRQPNPTLDTLSRYARAIGKRLALSLDDPTPQGVNPMAMKVNLSSAIRNDMQLAEQIEQINAMLADELGKGAALATATWVAEQDPRGRPLFTVELKDDFGGHASVSFAPNQVQHPEGLRDAIQRLRGRLLQPG